MRPERGVVRFPSSQPASSGTVENCGVAAGGQRRKGPKVLHRSKIEFKSMHLNIYPHKFTIY